MLKSQQQLPMQHNSLSVLTTSTSAWTTLAESSGSSSTADATGATVSACVGGELVQQAH